MSRGTAIRRVIRNALIITVISVLTTAAYVPSSVIETAALVLVGSWLTGFLAFRRDIRPRNQRGAE